MPKSATRKLVVSECFYSLQGEGPTAGVPAVFLRTAGCNMLCKFQRDDGTVALCDTVEVWRRGTPVGADELIADWQQRGWIQKLAAEAHLVVTGGEPLLQQEALAGFLAALKELVPHLFVEVETNATVMPMGSFARLVARWNCSPKLASSGVERAVRYRANVLEYFAGRAYTGDAVFKFVISSRSDIEEICRDYVERFAIPRRAVYLMPEGATRVELDARRAMVAQLAKEHGFRYTDRLHIILWDKATGV